MTDTESADGAESATVEHQPHSSADYDDMEYTDDRGIRVFDSDWTCPNCGDDGKLMFRPGSKNTCTECFWVIKGRYNDYVLDDWNMLYRHAQAVLADLGDDWHGTPGSVATALRKYYNTSREVRQAWAALNDEEEAVADGGTTETELGDWS